MTADILALKKSLKITSSPESQQYGLTEVSPYVAERHAVVSGGDKR